jgi:hypothetical protein
MFSRIVRVACLHSPCFPHNKLGQLSASAKTFGPEPCVGSQKGPTRIIDSSVATGPRERAMAIRNSRRRELRIRLTTRPRLRCPFPGQNSGGTRPELPKQPSETQGTRYLD